MRMTPDFVSGVDSHWKSLSGLWQSVEGRRPLLPQMRPVPLIARWTLAQPCGRHHPVYPPAIIGRKLDQLQRYLPAHLADKILANRGRLAGERKLVTVLFADLAGTPP